MSEEHKDSHEEKMGLGSVIAGFFSTAGNSVKATSKKAYVFAKKTVEENPVLVEAAFVTASTMRMHPKVRFLVLAGHTLYKVSQQHKSK